MRTTLVCANPCSIRNFSRTNSFAIIVDISTHFRFLLLSSFLFLIKPLLQYLFCRLSLFVRGDFFRSFFNSCFETSPRTHLFIFVKTFSNPTICFFSRAKLFPTNRTYNQIGLRGGFSFDFRFFLLPIKIQPPYFFELRQL